MDKQKENILSLVGKIYRALDTISVNGYSNIKTLSNCMDALQQLADDINSYESVGCAVPTNNGITPVNPNRPKPEPYKKDGD